MRVIDLQKLYLTKKHKIQTHQIESQNESTSFFEQSKKSLEISKETFKPKIQPIQSFSLKTRQASLVSKRQETLSNLNRRLMGHLKINPYNNQQLMGTLHQIGLFQLDSTKLDLSLYRALLVFEHILGRRQSILILSPPEYHYLFSALTRQSASFILYQKPWIGGLLTNWKQLSNYPIDLGLIFVTHPEHYPFVLREATLLNIPTMGLIDTENDPRDVTYPVYGNNDDTYSLHRFCTLLALLQKSA